MMQWNSYVSSIGVNFPNYVYSPMQYTVFFDGLQKWRKKTFNENSEIFLIFVQNIECRYSLERIHTLCFDQNKKNKTT